MELKNCTVLSAKDTIACSLCMILALSLPSDFLLTLVHSLHLKNQDVKFEIKYSCPYSLIH